MGDLFIHDSEEPKKHSDRGSWRLLAALCIPWEEDVEYVLYISVGGEERPAGPRRLNK
jgi:hypothetical protein